MTPPSPISHACEMWESRKRARRPSPGLTITLAAAGDTHTPCVCRPWYQLAVIGDQRPGVLCTVPHIASWIRGVWRTWVSVPTEGPYTPGPIVSPTGVIYSLCCAGATARLLQITGLERKRPLHRALFARSAKSAHIPIYRVSLKTVKFELQCKTFLHIAKNGDSEAL